jgi:hypothetical protein
MPVPCLDPLEFRKWLKKNYSKDVGFPGDFYNCPLANWLKDQGIPTVCVTDRKLIVRFEGDVEDTIYPLPEWVIEFNEAISDIFSSPDNNNAIPGYKALGVLDGCLSPIKEYEFPM